jgi:drug/metabolite transporter (DMT)-like permease
MVSVFYYKEPLSVEALIGITLILGAVVILAIQKDGVLARAEHQEVQAAK